MRRNVFAIICLVALGVILPSLLLAREGSVVISEVQLAGETAKDEFIELHNATDQSIGLAGWKLKKKTKSGKESNLLASFPETDIPARGFFLIAHPDGYAGDVPADAVYSGASYSAAADNAILLYDAEGVLTDKVGMGEAADSEGSPTVNPEAGQSVARKDGGTKDADDNGEDFEIKDLPGPQNSSSQPLAPGQAGEDSSPATESPDPSIQPVFFGSPAPTPIDYYDDILISEVFPNPQGPDAEKEFIELENIGDGDIDLSGWKLGDESGRKYCISRDEFESVMILPGEFFILPRGKTGIALNNSGGDTVSLYQPDDGLLDSVSYSGSAPEGQSYSESEREWGWSKTPTPGKENDWSPEIAASVPKAVSVGERAVFDASDTFDFEGETIEFAWKFCDIPGSVKGEVVSRVFDEPGPYEAVVEAIDSKGTKSEKAFEIEVTGEPAILSAEEDGPAIETEAKGVMDDEEMPVFETDRDEIRNKEKGDKVEVRGTVSARPGVLGKQVFYLSGPDIQIYMHRQDFPEMSEGDIVEVSGTLSESGGESRIKISGKEDIVIARSGRAPGPARIRICEIGEETEGSLAEISGEVLEIKGSYIYLDDGEEEARVYIKDSTGIEKPEIREGDTMRIAGIISQTKSGYRLLPRSQKDLEVIASDKDGLDEAEEEPSFKIAASADLQSDMDIALLREDRPGLARYLVVTAVFLVVLLVGLAVKAGLVRLPKKREGGSFKVTIEE